MFNYAFWETKLIANRKIEKLKNSKSNNFVNLKA